MRKALLMLGLAMLGVIMFASVAGAQPNGPAYDFLDVPNDIRPCPFDLGEVAEIYGPNVTCGEGGGYVLADSGDASPTASPTASPSASPTASPTASASASSAAESQYSAPSLPATGGAAPALPLAALALLVGGGLFAAFALRR